MKLRGRRGCTSWRQKITPFHGPEPGGMRVRLNRSRWCAAISITGGEKLCHGFSLVDLSQSTGGVSRPALFRLNAGWEKNPGLCEKENEKPDNDSWHRGSSDRIPLIVGQETDAVSYRKFLRRATIFYCTICGCVTAKITKDECNVKVS